MRYDLDAIMVEMLSWPGQSGSPAVVLESVIHNTISESNKLSSRIDSLWALLGVVSGHWELPAALAKEIERDAVDLDPAEESQRVRVNSGIALVTPVRHVINLLKREDVTRDRKAKRATERGNGTPRPSATLDVAEGS